MCPTNVLTRTKQQLFRILKSPAAKNKMPIAVRDSKDVMTCVTDLSRRIVPVFFISSVLGTNLPLLLEYMSLLQPRRDQSGAAAAAVAASMADGADAKDAEKALFAAPTEFSIDETFNVTGMHRINHPYRHVVCND
jgi:hypothetical protein